MPRRAGSSVLRDGNILSRPVEMEVGQPISIDWRMPKIPYTAGVREAVVNYRTGTSKILEGDEAQKTKIIRQLVAAAMCVIGCDPESFPITINSAVYRAVTTRVLDAETFASWGGAKQLLRTVKAIKNMCRDWPLDFALNAPLSLTILVLFLRNVPIGRSGAAHFITEHNIWNKLPTAIQKWENGMTAVYFAMVCPPYASAYPQGTSMKTYNDLVLAKTGGTFNRESSGVKDQSLSVGDEQSQDVAHAQSQLNLPSPVHETPSEVVAHTVEPRASSHAASSMLTPPAEKQSFEKTVALSSLSPSVMSPIENARKRVAGLATDSKNVPRDQHDQFASRLLAELDETKMPLLSLQDRMSIYVWISNNKPDLPLYHILKRSLFGTEAGASQDKTIQKTPVNKPPGRVAKLHDVGHGSQVQELPRLNTPQASKEADEPSNGHAQWPSSTTTADISLKRSRTLSTSEQSLVKVSRRDDGRLHRSAPVLSGDEQKPVGQKTEGGHMTATARVAARKLALIDMALGGMAADPSKKRIEAVRKQLRFFKNRLCDSSLVRDYIQRHREELKLELADALSGSEAGD
ncbi:hypothetical protein GQ602_001645 [Ophiocordyceps camponoti-floridani]|uniref:Uncharacterized protein n=1 Tax=Ophiocordyceps camponoti-floridani TaxID=2030778 RepID=A0A8H4Q8U5_9HYPO|nr:hypothetical protein GQ602_001645 [Ophiocordyceps camponoti-floridani]